MDERTNENTQQGNPRRRKRSQAQIFKEAYLPVIIAGVALILILIFIIGSITRAVQKSKIEKEASIAASESIAAEEARLDTLAQTLLAQAAPFAEAYEYEMALSILNTFDGDMSKYPDLAEKVAEYSSAKATMVAWTDPSKVPNLSFHLLMADPKRAFEHDEYGSAFNRNYVTTGECEKILQQLYDNGYVLVSLDDIVTTETTQSGATVYKAKTLYLPEGKKPIMLTQTNVNYNIYMVDGDGDKLPDKDGAGFASKLVLDASGKILCEMVDSEGNTVTGAYDLVPILDAFVEKHPDFSYKGAKAILALTGYNGLFGYRTYSGAEDDFGADAYNEAVAEATKVAAALRDSGYDFACYTYDNVPYGDYSESMVKNDLGSWVRECVPILGSVNIMAFAQQSDIAGSGNYSGEKYMALMEAGMRYYLGFCTNDRPWASFGPNYFRQGRILVTGSNMAHHANWFEGMFDAEQVLDMEARGEVPA